MSALVAESLAAAPSAHVERSLRFRSMGGWVTLRVAGPAGVEAAADRDLRLLAGRIESWAARITRFDEGSELAALNRAAGRPSSRVGPSLGCVLERARQLSEATDGLVDVTLLDARLAAEGGGGAPRGQGRWWLERGTRGHRVYREDPVRFDLDGVGKGWIADRALALLGRYPAAMVDADGDIALRSNGAVDWGLAIADPRWSGSDLATVAAPPGHEAVSIGVATSGTTVHRWEHGTGWSHHLIDPRTGRSAGSDVVQATVVAGSALGAETLAKSVVIAGSEDGLRLLEHHGVSGAFILLTSGELVAPPGAEAWLA